MTLVTGVGEEYWTPGTDSLLLPTADNPVLGWWHDWHVARHEAGTAWGPVHEIGLLTREEFRTLPAMAAAPGIEDDSWIVWVNQAVSQRDFC